MIDSLLPVEGFWELMYANELTATAMTNMTVAITRIFLPTMDIASGRIYIQLPIKRIYEYRGLLAIKCPEITYQFFASKATDADLLNIPQSIKTAKTQLIVGLFLWLIKERWMKF